MLTLRFGIRGLLGCACSFCLSPVMGLSQQAAGSAQDGPEQRIEAPISELRAALLIQHLQQQNEAVLQALEQLRADRNEELHQYSESMAGQFSALKETLAFGRDEQMQATRDSNRFLLTATAVLTLIALITMLLTLLLPFWALKRMEAARAGAMVRGVSVLTQTPGWGSAGLPLLTSFGSQPLNPHLTGAVEQFEQRLLALERRASQSEAPLPKNPAPPANVPGGAKSALANVSSKSSKSPHVAITLGAGEAIIFLPREPALGKFGAVRVFIGKLKTVLLRIRNRV